MKWIFNSKNLTKKIFVFFLLFFIFGGIRNTNADVYIRNNLTGSDHILATSSNPATDEQKINTDVLEGDHSFKYLFLTDYKKALKSDYIDAITTKYNIAISSITNDTNKDEEKSDLDSIKNNTIKLEGTAERFLDTTYDYVFKTLRNDKNHGYVMSYGGTNQVNAVTNKARRLYMYYYFNDQILPIATKYKNSKNSFMKDIYTYATSKIDKLKNGASGNLYGEEEALKDEEINGSYIVTTTYDVTKGVFIGEEDGRLIINATPLTEVFKLPIVTTRQNNNGTGTVIPPDAPNTGKATIASGLNNCPQDINFASFIKGALPLQDSLPVSCSLSAYLVNAVISGIGSLFSYITDLAGALFDWIYQVGVIGFKSWVIGSDAYRIYKTIIVSLIISVMPFVIFYWLGRRLLDDSGERSDKVFLRLALTLLLISFMFTITGWIIDQSNIITIYLYRSMTHQDPSNPQKISDALETTLKLKGGKPINGGLSPGENIAAITSNYGISWGSWDAVPYTLGQLAVNIVSVFILFQGAILLLSRTIVLLLCMIFSPIMLIPDGLTEFTDKYKGMVINNFTGNIFLGPVFMFLMVVAIEIGNVTTKMVGDGPSDLATAPTGSSHFLGGIISSVLVIVVLQLAISAAKNLSGSIGEKIGGVISKYAGGAAFGGGAKILRNTLGRGASIAKDRGWMMGQEGSRRHQLMSSLYGSIEKSTFDARNTKAATFAVGANTLGRGSNETYSSSYNRKLYDAKKYSNTLGAEGQKRYVERLKSSANPDNQKIAKALEGNWKPSINERINNDSAYNEKLDKAVNEKDTDKRKTEVDKMMDEHFKQNGLGSQYFSKEIEKPQNNKLKTSYTAALSKEKPEERKEELAKVISELEKKEDKSKTSLESLKETIIADKENKNTQNTYSNPKPSEANHENINSLRTRLQAKYSKEDVKEYQQKRMNFYQEKSLKEATEKQNAEIAAQKEQNGGYIPDAKNLDAQQSLKERLQAKYSKEDVANYRRKQEENYQNKVLDGAQMEANVQFANSSTNQNKGDNNNGQELSNSSVSSEPPKITLDTGSGNKIEIPLTKKDGKPNIMGGDTKVFSQN